MKLHSIDTGFFKLDGGAMFGVVPKQIWQNINPPDEKNLCNWALRSLLIETGDRLVLVDCGIGDKQDAKFLDHYHLHGAATLNSSLNKAGFAPEDITDVILTHLHFDHCGGAISRNSGRLQPTFPNADYWSNAEHWAWATRPNAREKASFLTENILPLQESGRLKFVAPPGADPSGKLGRSELPFGVSVRFVHGHTRAMMLPEVTVAGQTIVFMADLLPSAGHIPMPYIMAYDMFPVVSLEEKASFLEEAVAGNYVLFFQHDPLVECCRLEHTPKGIRGTEAFALGGAVTGSE